MSIFQKMKDSANSLILFIDQMIGPILIALGIISIFSSFSKGYIANKFTLSNPGIMIGAGILSILLGIIWIRFIVKNK